MNLSISLFGKKLKNPLFLPSGIITDIKAHKIAWEAGVGLITLKSITLQPREGNPYPRMVKFSCGYLNSIGLKNPGFIQGKKQIKEFINNSPIPIVISIYGASIEEFKIMAKDITDLKPFALELNFSCPNVKNKFGEMFAHQGKSSYQIVKEVKKIIGEIPLIAKLSPNIANIKEIAKACEDAGVSAISAINTVFPTMLIDIYRKKPILGAKFGGMSGPAIKPIAIAKIWEIYEVVKIPILGMGGVESWQDAVEMMMAGAALVGVGSGVYRKGWEIYKEILKGIEIYLKKEKIKSVEKIIGLAHY